MAYGAEEARVDRRRFDALTRVLAGAGSRRQAVASLAGGLLGMTSLAEPAAARNRKRRKDRRKKVRAEGPCGNGKPKKNRCKRDRQCCTNYCKKRRCRCRKDGQSCTEDRNCCPERTGRTCVDGVCQPPPASSCGDVCERGCQFSNVQDAIDNAGDDDTIRLCAETYRGTMAITKSLTLLGVGDGEDGTILEGQGDNSVVLITGGTSVELKALRVTGGNALNGAGGGVNNSAGAGLTITDCTVTGNAAVDGGGISSLNGDLILNDSSVSGNTAIGSGGIYFNDGELTLNGASLVSGNNVTGDIGGITAIRASITLNHSSRVQNNTALGFAGGIYNAESTLILNNDSSVTVNIAGTHGGGIVTVPESTLILNDDSSVTGNTAGTTGGGIHNAAGTQPPESATVNLNDHSTVSGNTAGADGGGIYNDGGEVTLSVTSSVTGHFAPPLTPNNCGGDTVPGCVG